MRKVIRDEIEKKYKSVNAFVKESGTIPYSGLLGFLNHKHIGIHFDSVQKAADMLGLAFFEKGEIAPGANLREQLSIRIEREKSRLHFCETAAKVPLNYSNFNGFLNGKRGIYTCVFETAYKRLGLELRPVK